jgi:sulfoxide reductase catalytic subunit YedY
MVKIRSWEITPRQVYLSRRRLMVGAGALIAGSVLGAGCAPPDRVGVDATAESGAGDSSQLSDELTSLEAITGYNNFYEFSLDKVAVARRRRASASPWTVRIGGHVAKPRSYWASKTC